MASFAAAFADVTPVEQDDGPAPVCAIAYAPEYARLMGFFRAILESNERSPRVLELTAALAEHNAAHYTVWHVRRECLWALASSDASILNDELRYSRRSRGRTQKIIRSGIIGGPSSRRSG